MYDYVSTPLFASPAQTIVNTVNTVGVMGKGVAAEFKGRYPEMYTRYKEFCDTGLIDIGKLYVYRTPNKWILNFPTKKHWRHPSRLEYLEAGLRKFVDTYTEQGITSISFPQLGCGNGNLQWRAVQPLMENYLGKLPIPVFVHLTQQHQNFVPEHLTMDDRFEMHQSRQDVGFHQLWQDLNTSADVISERSPSPSYEERPSLIVRLPDNRQISLPGDELEELWHGLRLRGALRMDEFPGQLREHAELVSQLLLRLDYIEPIWFAETGKTEDLRTVSGIQYAPLAVDSEPRTFSVEAA